MQPSSKAADAWQRFPGYRCLWMALGLAHKDVDNNEDTSLFAQESLGLG